ncbi:hypothetical protein P3W85_00465 [Cupriavidus basilensis]|uniref:Type IV toxin-antitoxin system AbiEi family antitoxin domain-containing protein n=1 Tax=Cupriavidus basilensis TaxID=68895 RepID=A0ABT6AFR6_9BURK|nr:hypothetical protein [Cupriavidus basilensis]MDF3831441.1 hypothetical protein [Cupriavidus basilensis]
MEIHAVAATAPNPVKSLRRATAHLADGLRAGRVYRREDLARMSNAVDRHLRELVASGQLKKLAQGLYYAPRTSSFGPLPPDDVEVVGGFLRDKDFLVFSPSAYNAIGLGTTQLYNRTLVYNHKRHGVFKLGNRQFDFRVKPRFPKKLTPEFLFVDLLNNLNDLAEDRDAVLRQARDKLPSFDRARLQRALDSFANVATRKRVREWDDG